MATFRKKPVVIEAHQFTGDNLDDLEQWIESCGGRTYPTTTAALNIETLEGVMTARVGDWIIRGVQGEFYPCKPDIFEQTYESPEDDR